MPRNAENDQQSNAPSDHPLGSASSQLRRYRRGRHISNARLGPLIERATSYASLALIRSSRIDPREADIDATIALARKFGVIPLADGLYPNLPFPRTWKQNPPRPEMAASIAASIALGAMGIFSWTVVSPVSAAPETRPHVVAAAANPALNDVADRTRTDGAASRNYNRPKAAPDAAGPAQKAQDAARPQNAARPDHPAPVAGLDQAAMDNAVAVVRAGQEMNLPKRAFVVAIATTLQESKLRNLANPGVPDSMNLPNEGTGQDYDSVGLFQQRASMGWGTVDQLMDPKSSARAFYSRLITISGWEQMNIANAAQAVQQSAFPDAYAQWEARAQQIVDAIA